MKFTKTQQKVLSKLITNTNHGMPWVHIEYRVDGKRMLKAAGDLVRIGILKVSVINGLPTFEAAIPLSWLAK